METIILIINFCTNQIDPNFDKFACLEQMTECMSRGNEFEYCTDYWD